MTLRFVFICSAVLFMACQLDQVYGAPNAGDRNRQRNALKAALKAIAVDLEAWNKISKDKFGLNTRAGNLLTIIAAVKPISLVNSSDFRKDKTSPSDAKMVEQAKVKTLAASAANILSGLNKMSIDVNGNPQNEAKAKLAIETFYKSYTTTIATIKAEWGKKGVLDLLNLKD